MNDANADLVNELRVPSDADDEAIQEALKKLFNAQCSVQCRDQSDAREGQAIRASGSVFRSDQALKADSSQALKASDTDQFQSSTVSESGPSPVQFQVQDQFRNVSVSINSSQESQCTLLASRSSISIDNSLREKMYSLLQRENYYKEILEEIESTGRNEVKRGQEKYKLQKKLLTIHVAGQPEEDVQYWRVVVPDDLGVKSLLVSELHSVPYAAHPGVQRTLDKVRRYFWWRGMTGDVREFVESCPTCQLEKTDHTLKKGSLQSLTLPEGKWREVSIDFITDLPAEEGAEDSIMTDRGSCDQDGALDPVLEDDHRRRSCTTVLAAGGTTSWNPSCNPHRQGCAICRQMVERNLVVARDEIKIRNCVSSAKPGTG